MKYRLLQEAGTERDIFVLRTVTVAITFELQVVIKA